jgi:1,6-anhydro-N-acetylmuramate kinase
MTGTSIDAIDVALVRVDGTGLAMRATFVRGVSRSLGDLAPSLRRLAEQEPMTAGDIARLSRAFALLHVDVLRELAGADTLAMVSAHGQTVFHAPPASWQLLDPAPIAMGLRVPVVTHLRGADLALGGQGAPITPLSDWVMLRSRGESRAVVNLGGFCNITLLPGDAAGASGGTESELLASAQRVAGCDVCACNHVLDTVARRCLGSPFDQDGQSAMAGTVHDDALDDLRAVLMVQASGKRSLGTGDEVTGWIGRYRAMCEGADLAATACEAIAEMIAAKVAGVDRVLLAGGGCMNRALVRAIASCCSASVQTTTEHGVDGRYREAAAMAVLGALCQDGVPITLSAATRCPVQPPRAGVWAYPS